MTTSAYGGYGPALLGVCWTFFIITTALLALRVYVRMKITTEGGWALFWTFVGFVSLQRAQRPAIAGCVRVVVVANSCVERRLR